MKRNKKDIGEDGSLALWLATHTGRVRDNNEDNFTVNNVSKKIEYKNVRFNKIYSQPLVAAVFDGMGGEAMGEHASRIAAEEARKLIGRLKQNSIGSPDELIAEYVQLANDAIRDFLEENRCSSGGSTVAAVIIKNGIAHPFSMGDSRIYLFRDSSLSLISKDHTLAMKKYEANIYTLEEAEKSSDSHKLTMFLGNDYLSGGVAPQIYDPIVLQTDDVILLCSDGLYDECSNQEIESVLKSSCENPAYELLKRAIAHGGGDNVTCLVIRMCAR